MKRSVAFLERRPFVGTKCVKNGQSEIGGPGIGASKVRQIVCLDQSADWHANCLIIEPVVF